MVCYYHKNKNATDSCSECGKPICRECAKLFRPATCVDCASDIVSQIKKEMVSSIFISIILMIVGCIIIKSPAGILLAGIPYGWNLLTRITPNIFLWMSWIGWLIYFFVKLLLAYFIGLVALPVKLIMWISKLAKVNRIQKNINHVN